MVRMIPYSVYILSNFARTVFYTGVTNMAEKRIQEHRSNEGSVFAAKYKCYFLVYFEDYNDINNAIAREKQLKNWKREWKLKLIREHNPDLKDLAENW